MTLRLSKRIRNILIIASGFILFTQLTSGCFSFRMSKSEVQTYFKDRLQVPGLHQYKEQSHTINYASIGSDSLPTVIFFHGSPGSWTAFIDIMKDDTLLSKAQIVSVDRPGFGHSDFGEGIASLAKQAKVLKPILAKFDKTPNILVGHSLGGPLIARLAMDYPEFCEALVMVAPSIDPSLEPNEDWFRYPLQTPFLSWIMPTSFRVSNEEIYVLKDELNKMIPLWSTIQQPITIIQGTDDILVSPANADFGEEMLTNAQSVDIIRVKGVDHFIPWDHPELIKTALLKYLH